MLQQAYDLLMASEDPIDFRDGTWWTRWKEYLDVPGPWYPRGHPMHKEQADAVPM